MSLSDKKIIFFSGKGGVGKSLLSLAFSIRQSLQGKRVLLAELGESGFFEYQLGALSVPDLSFSPQSAYSKWPNLSICRWEGRECLEDYVKHILKVGGLVHAFMSHPAMGKLIDAAPALSDVSILGKATSHIRDVGPDMPYDMVVIDAYSSGHFMSMLRAALGLAEAIQVGPMGQQSREIHQVLTDSSLCGYCLVTTPEPFAISESIELNQKLIEFGNVQSHIFLNQTFAELNLPADSNPFLEFMRKKNQQQKEAEGLLADSSFASITNVRRIFSHSPEEILEAIVADSEGWQL